ncbi:hypothetical protein [Sphingobacterium nematocida]|uniref:hypothetical protein n=1 Tax=Sphingobacterium nematocida TaxID=1513896 RepID=UPI001116F937|nr:hypothetical protein [Sphingobacterium nematocida]
MPFRVEQKRWDGFEHSVARCSPMCGHCATQHIRRRRWTVLDTRAIITRDWNLVRERARMTTEFGFFLKKIFG